MSVYFSEKFKQLRKINDLTQEQIADTFQVSPQSVSRWETGANYPDVELLPHIAIYFNVTIDELFGTDEIRSEEKVKEYIKDIRNLMNSGRLNEAINLSRRAIKEYPLNSGLQYHLLQALRKSDSDKHKAEIISIGERIIKNDPNNWGIKIQIIEQYAAWGLKGEARKIIDTMPGEVWYSKEPWLGLVLEGEEWNKNQKHRIIRAKYLLEYFISGYLGKSDLTVVQKIEYRKAKMQIEMSIDTISGQEIVYLEHAFQYIDIAELYCEAGDIENALDNIEKATQDSLHHIDQMDKTNADDGGNYMAWSTPRNLPWIMWEDHLLKPKFDIVRNDQRFIKCLELLKSNSRELTK